MKKKIASLFRFETVIVVLILVAFSLAWISWRKLLVPGWDLPVLYRKMTNTSNAILFFKKDESPYLAYFIYIVPVLGLLSLLPLFNLKRRTANIILSIACILGIAVSLYMYYYFISSKVFKLSNAGLGIHLLCLISLIGLFYSLAHCGKKKKVATEPESGKETLIQEDSIDRTENEPPHS